jgi:hypothetical protein
MYLWIDKVSSRRLAQYGIAFLLGLALVAIAALAYYSYQKHAEVLMLLEERNFFLLENASSDRSLGRNGRPSIDHRSPTSSVNVTIILVKIGSPRKPKTKPSNAKSTKSPVRSVGSTNSQRLTKNCSKSTRKCTSSMRTISHHVSKLSIVIFSRPDARNNTFTPMLCRF